MVIGGESIHGDEILELYEMIVKEEWRSGSGRETADGSVLPAYREAIVARHTCWRARSRWSRIAGTGSPA